MAQFALRWVLDQAGRHGGHPRCPQPEQAARNASVAGLPPLPDEARLGQGGL
jgi:hypothetical protein